MNRLFFKIFAWFTAAALLVTGLAVAVWDATRPGSQDPFAAFGVQATSEPFADGSTVRVDQLQVMKQPLRWLARSGIGIVVFTADGRVLLESNEEAVSVLRPLVAQSFDSRAGLAKAGPGGSLLLAIPIDEHTSVGSLIPPQRGPLPASAIAIRAGAVVLIVLLVCLALARYLSAPVEKFREATARFAAGDLSARVGPWMGRRRDELADAGRDFDVMADRIQTLIESDRRLMADISHELRSPLARLAVAVDLERTAGASESRPMLDRIEREARRLDELIAQLLTLGRLRNSAQRPEQASVDLLALCREVAVDAEFEAHSTGRRIAVDGGEHCVVPGDPSLLRSALENLVRNAIRYTPPNTEVQVDVERAPGGVRVLVRDHGSGVPEESLERIFEPFYREDESRARETGGAGLGLAIVQRVVALHEGAVQARGAPGGGLEVDVLLPGPG